MKEPMTFEWEPKDGHAAGIPVENVEMPPDEAKEKTAAFIKRIWPWIKDSAEARGLPPYLVAMSLRAIADTYDAIPMKEES
mgnify:CR=1 FL=1